MKNNKMTFMDFCSGVGGARVALEKLKMKCVGHSEINEKADKTYKLFFGEKEKNYGDLMKIDSASLPDFDVLMAGFPCQTFSIAGKRKGFSDPRGTIIYGLIKILKAKNIKYFILENVKGLVNVDGGNTLEIIKSELDKAGYEVEIDVLNSIYYGVPQMRERIYFLGIRKDLSKGRSKLFLKTKKKPPSLKKFLISEDKNFVFDKESKSYKTFLNYLNNKYNKGKYNLEKLLKQDYLVLDTRQSDLRIYKDRVPTLRTGRHGILYVKDGQLRRLTGEESLMLQGFGKTLSKKAQSKIDNTALLSQTGNAMTANVIEELATRLLNKVN